MFFLKRQMKPKNYQNLINKGGFKMREMVLGREKILNSIAEGLKPLDYVYAMWQCGSAAFGRVDEWSDIDVVIDVEDDRLKDVFEITDKVLKNLAPIERTYGGPQTMSLGSYQKVYKLKGISKFLIIEVCAVKHSSTEKFLQREIHGEIFVHFDKKNVTDNTPINKAEFAQKLRSRIDDIENMFNMYQILVEKELNRHNYIEAMQFFLGFTVSLLLEALRIKYKPYRHGFRTRYVYYDLPKDVALRLQGFYFIKDGEELREKHQEAIKWFDEIIDELKKIDMEEIL